jgi:hypothetical protein
MVYTNYNDGIAGFTVKGKSMLICKANGSAYAHHVHPL